MLIRAFSKGANSLEEASSRTGHQQWDTRALFGSPVRPPRLLNGSRRKAQIYSALRTARQHLWTHNRSCRQQLSVPQASRSSGQEQSKDEPEATVLLVACIIGLASGAGVVVFNEAILLIRKFAFLQVPVDDISWATWSRQLNWKSNLLVTLLPPTVGGITVGLFRYLVGGFSDPPQQPEGSVAQKAVKKAAPSFFSKVQGLGEDLLSTLQRKGPLNSGPEESKAESKAAALSAPDVQGDGTAEQPVRPDTSLRRQLRYAIAPFLRTGAAAITLGTGCSLGPEGPSVEIGRSCARALGRVLRSKNRRLVPLLAAGSGAGVAAGFNAPIAGVFFAVESVLQREPVNSETEAKNSSGLTVAMILLASVLAALVSRAGLGDTPAFKVPQYEIQSVWELPLILVLGAICGVTSVGFSYLSEVSTNTFKKFNPGGPQEPSWILLPAIGGLCTGAVALIYPEISYQGFSNVNSLLAVNGEDYAPMLLLQMLIAKVAVTAVCRGSGLVGGIYAPSIFMGAALGSGFGGLAQMVLSHTGYSVTAPAAYALVGVAGMLAANCQVPLTAVLLLFELTHDYFIIIPTLAAVGISYWVSSLPITFDLTKIQQYSSPSVGEGLVSMMEDEAEDEAKPRRIRIGAYIPGTEKSSRRFAVSPQIELNPGQKAVLENGTEGPLQASTSANSNADGKQGISAVVSNGAEKPKVESIATAAVANAASALTAECAFEGNCVLVTKDTSLAEALLLLEENSQTAALVLDDEQMVRGVLTKDKIISALEQEASIKAGERGLGADGTLTVELVVGIQPEN